MREKIIALSALLALTTGCAATESVLDAPSPFDTEEWPTQFSRQQLIDAATNNYSNYFDGRDLEGSPVLVLDEGVPSWANLIADHVVGTLPGIDQAVVVVGFGPSILKQSISQHSFKMPDQLLDCISFQSDDSIGGCAGPDMAWTNLAYTKTSGEIETSESLPSIVAHELFHSFQDTYSSDTPSGLWVVEGTAEFFGYATLDYLGISEYEVSVTEPWYFMPRPAPGGLKQHETLPLAWNAPPVSYWTGQLATEYLVANAGMDALINLFVNMESMPFSVAFKEAVGISLDEFYTIFDEAYSTLYKNTDTKTEDNIDYCPEFWDCTVDVYTQTVSVIDESVSFAEEGDDWVYGLPTPVTLPKVPENSGHDLDVAKYRITPDLSCNQFVDFGWDNFRGIAAGYNYTNNEDIPVSTQWYVIYSELDANADGIICGEGD